MKTISLKIPESLELQLQRSASEAGINKSELLRQALEHFLARSEVARSTSVAALAADLAGCFRGPEDLSTDASQFDEYGQ